MIKKLIVMDHATQALSIYPYDENVWESPEHYTTEDGEMPINGSTDYMVVNEVNITVH